MTTEELRKTKGIIFAIDQTAVHDGPGLRMNVYLKGCPLSCVWCHSPEGISPDPQIIWYKTKCTECGKCVEVCPEALIKKINDHIDFKFNSGTCLECRLCIRVCPTGALEIKGKIVMAGEIVEEAIRLKPFFKRTGGGITLTGGEPTFQSEFSYAILFLCKTNNINTVLETSGYTSWENLKRLASVTDIFFYDIKHFDEALHKKFTNVSLNRILENLKNLVEIGADITVRIPLIPGYNDSHDTICSIAHMVNDLGVKKISLLPFNPSAGGKYSWIQKPFPLNGIKSQTDEEIKKLREEVKTNEKRFYTYRAPGGNSHHRYPCRNVATGSGNRKGESTTGSLLE